MKFLRRVLINILSKIQFSKALKVYICLNSAHAKFLVFDKRIKKDQNVL